MKMKLASLVMAAALVPIVSFGEILATSTDDAASSNEHPCKYCLQTGKK